MADSNRPPRHVVLMQSNSLVAFVPGQPLTVDDQTWLLSTIVPRAFRSGLVERLALTRDILTPMDAIQRQYPEGPDYSGLPQYIVLEGEDVPDTRTP